MSGNASPSEGIQPGWGRDFVCASLPVTLSPCYRRKLTDGLERLPSKADRGSKHINAQIEDPKCLRVLVRRDYETVGAQWATSKRGVTSIKLDRPVDSFILVNRRPKPKTEPSEPQNRSKQNP